MLFCNPIHRGVYDAAVSMYDSFLPLVQEHLACAGPGAQVAFTGHSLGGSLATVLTLLMVHRCGARLSVPLRSGCVRCVGWAPAAASRLCSRC